MKKAASILIIMMILVASVLPSFAYYEGPYTYPYWIKYLGVFTLNSSQKCTFSDGWIHVPTGANYIIYWKNDINMADTVAPENCEIGNNTMTLDDANYTVGNIVKESITYTWSNNQYFNSEGSYTKFRTFAISLGITTTGYEPGELTFKRYLQKNTTSGWSTLNLPTEWTFATNTGIGQQNDIPLWSIMPFTAGEYRFIVNAYADGVIVPGGSTTANITLQNASQSTFTPAKPSIDIGGATSSTPTTINPSGGTYTAEEGRKVAITSPEDYSTHTLDYLMRVGVYGVVDNQITVDETYSEESIIVWSVNPTNPSIYDGHRYSLNGRSGDTEFSTRQKLPDGNGMAYVIVTGGDYEVVKDDYYNFESEDGKFYHYFDSVTIYTKPSVTTGRGSDYSWLDDPQFSPNGTLDIDSLTAQLEAYIKEFGTFFTMMQSSMVFIPGPLMAIVIFAATLSLILVVFRR